MMNEEPNVDEQEAEEGMSSKLLAMADSLIKKRDIAVQFRAACGVERMWREDEALYAGRDIADGVGQGRMIDYATGDSFVQKKPQAKRSRVVINVVRPKCELAEGRFSDILLPVDDRNYGLKTTPDPELEKQMKDQRPAMQAEQPVMKTDGTQAQVAEVAQHKQKTAQEKMAGMERVIDDQLTECSFNGECRKVIRSGVRWGTGILKGPTVINRVKHKWTRQTDETGEVFVLDTKEDRRPASKSLDKWNVYPDPDCDENIQNASYIWERGTILPRDIRKLLKMDREDGYFQDQLKLVLEEEPRRTTVDMDDKKGGSAVKIDAAQKGQYYETWEYNGDVNKEDLLAAGCECEDLDGVSISACVLFINDRPVKVELNELDTGELPYDFFTWSPIPGSPWGIGIPRIMMWQQRVMTAAWRAMMDNAGESAGANTVVGHGIEPADGNWQRTANKTWLATGEVEDVRAAFAQFQITNNQEAMAAIIDMALRFIDQETALPTLFNGEAKTAPETLGATNIMVDANNVSLRQRVKLWDDSITRPHLTRYYTWNMQYHPDNEIKDDYCVDPRGTSVLYEKDQRAQALLQAFSLKNDPDIGPKVKWDKAAKMFFESLHLDIMKDENELQADQQQQQGQQAPPNPQAEVATIRTEGALKQEEMRQQSDMAELNFKAQENEKQRQHERAIREMEMNIEMLKLSNAKGIDLAKIKATLAQTSQKLNVQVALAKEGAGSKTREVLKPASEPPQHAAPGQSFPD